MTPLTGWRFTIPSFDEPSAGGWGVQLTHTGRPATNRDAEVTRQSILLLLSTVPGERVMRPSYGCRLHELAFAPLDETTAGLAMHFVRRAVQQWVPQAEIVEVDAEPDPDDDGVLRIHLHYRHRPTGMAERVEIGVRLDGEGV